MLVPYTLTGRAAFACRSFYTSSPGVSQKCRDYPQMSILRSHVVAWSDIYLSQITCRAELYRCVCGPTTVPEKWVRHWFPVHGLWMGVKWCTGTWGGYIEPRCAPDHVDWLTYTRKKKQNRRRHDVCLLKPVAMCQWQLHGIDWRRNWDEQKVCVRDYGSILSELISKDWFDMLESIRMNMEGFAWRIRIRYKASIFFLFFYKDVKDNNDRHAKGCRRPCARSPTSNPNGKVRTLRWSLRQYISTILSDGDQGER